MARQIRIVFDGPPGNVCGRFVEVEDEHGAGMSIGDWESVESFTGPVRWHLILDPEKVVDQLDIGPVLTLDGLRRLDQALGIAISEGLMEDAETMELREAVQDEIARRVDRR